jgi:type IV pilus assembly protein PilC
MPIMGKMFKKLAVMRFCQTTGGALAAGVQTFDALDLAGRSSGSRWVRATVAPMQDAVREGRPLSTALEAHRDLYPPTVRTLVATGEATGELANMMHSSATVLEDEIDVTVSTMSAKIEVALLLFMAISVGGILVALYLPILTLTTTISESF